MIAVVSDTHGNDDARLTGRTRTAVETADLVIHAGDFVTAEVLDQFEAVAAELHAVCGNVDDEEVCARLPQARTVAYRDRSIAVTHTADGGDTALALFGRERGADLVVSGHSHRPGYTWTGALGLLNPGSHAQPRGNRPGHAELEVTDGVLEGTLLEPDGTVFQRFEIR